VAAITRSCVGTSWLLPGQSVGIQVKRAGKPPSAASCSYHIRQPDRGLILLPGPVQLISLVWHAALRQRHPLIPPDDYSKISSSHRVKRQPELRKHQLQPCQHRRGQHICACSVVSHFEGSRPTPNIRPDTKAFARRCYSQASAVTGLYRLLVCVCIVYSGNTMRQGLQQARLLRARRPRFPNVESAVVRHTVLGRCQQLLG
jgi:hypothetical protein